jgi:hypothetical protein
LILAAILAVSFSVFARPQAASAVNPTTINFQGKVVNANGTNVTDGTYSFTFKLYSVASGGAAIWGETQASVSVLSGVFQVNLGSTCSLFITQTCSSFSNTAIDFNANPALYLGITFNGDAAGEMTPRPQLQSVPYAFNADKVGGLTAAQLVQLSPAGAQTGFININGGNTLINNTGTGNTSIGGSSGTIGVGGASAGVITLQSAAAINLTAAANSILNFGANTLSITSSTLTVAPTTGVLTLGGTTPTLTATTNQNLSVQTAGTGQLTLNTGSTGILGLGSAITTLQSSSAALTLDLNNAGLSTFTIKNSGAGVADLNLFGGSLQTGSTPTTRLDNAGNLLNIGTITASGLETLSFTGGTALAVTGAPLASATSSLIQYGSPLAAGNAVANGGTYLGINAPASGAGSAADLINLQVAGSSQLRLDTVGNLYGSGFDEFDPSKLGGATTSVGNYSAGGNFGTAFSSGAFIDNTDIYAQEFVASLVSATTNNRNIGDSTNWYFNNNAALSGQPTSQDISTTGGFMRIGMANTTNRSAIVSQGATPGAPDKPINALNLPIIQVKVRTSVVRATDDFVWGASDSATVASTNDLLPANGIFFWTNNSTGAGGWTGVVRSGGATIGTPVVCPGGITPNVFATGRIIVVNSTTVRFMIDDNAGDGIVFQDCGTVTGALPAADLALQMYDIHTTNTAATFDIDYARFWQDDAPVSSAAASATVQNQQSLADISTGQDDQTNQLADTAATPASPPTDGLSANENITPAAPAVPPSDTGVSQTSFTSDTLQPDVVQADNKPTTGTFTTKDGNLELVDTAGKSVFTVNSSGDGYLSGNLNLSSASISGGLTVGGDINVAGLSTFQKLATFIAKTVFRQDVQFDGHITVAADSAGYATLRKTETTVHIKFKTAYDDVPVVSANTVDGQFVPATVSNINTAGFDLSVATPATQDTKFSWTAIGVNNPQTAVNPVPITTTPTPTPATP